MPLSSGSPALPERIARALAADLGLPQPAAPRAPDPLLPLARWIDLVATWNARIDLTAARSDDELVDLMLADALALAALLPASLRVVDVGTGAGAPGLPLAILRPDLQLTLVEPLQKRVSFLRNAIGALLQAGEIPAAFPVARARGEDIAATTPLFDAAVSRATLAPARWLELGAALTAGAPAPEVWVLLAREDPPTLSGWSPTTDFRYRWPLTGADRRIVRYTPA